MCSCAQPARGIRHSGSCAKTIFWFFFFSPLVYSGLFLPKNPKISPAKFSLILISIVLLFIICGFVGNSKGKSRGLFAKFYSANPNIRSMLEVIFFLLISLSVRGTNTIFFSFLAEMTLFGYVVLSFSVQIGNKLSISYPEQTI